MHVLSLIPTSSIHADTISFLGLFLNQHARHSSLLWWIHLLFTTGHYLASYLFPLDLAPLLPFESHHFGFHQHLFGISDTGIIPLPTHTQQ